MSKLIVLLNYVPKRHISLSATCEGKRNFRKFMFINKRGSNIFKRNQAKNPDPDIPIDRRGVRLTGYVGPDGKFVEVPEMVPELIVPDLRGCDLKPYVSYKAPTVVQSKFTAVELFNAVYSEKIIADFKTGKLDASGLPLEPSREELITPEEAKTEASKTGTDIFTTTAPFIKPTN